MSQTHQGSLWIPVCIPYSVVNKALEFFFSLASPQLVLPTEIKTSDL